LNKKAINYQILDTHMVPKALPLWPSCNVLDWNDLRGAERAGRHWPTEGPSARRAGWTGPSAPSCPACSSQTSTGIDKHSYIREHFSRRMYGPQSKP